MKSRINLDVDYAGQPCIKINLQSSEDIRDKTLTRLLNQVEYPNNNGYKIKFPKNIFVIEEDFDNSSCSSGYGEPGITKTLVPIDRIVAQKLGMIDPRTSHCDNTPVRSSIIDDINRVRDLYRLLNLETSDIDRIENILETVPHFKNKLNKYTLIEYPQFNTKVLSYINENDFSEHILIDNGKIMSKYDFEENYLGKVNLSDTQGFNNSQQISERIE